MFDFFKRQKGTKMFAPLVFFAIIFTLYVGVNVYDTLFAQDNISNTTSSASSDASSEQNNEEEQTGEQKEDNDKPIFDLHIGWSNIIVFGVLAAALIYIRRKDDKSIEKQHETKNEYYAEENDDETDYR